MSSFRLRRFPLYFFAMGGDSLQSPSSAIAISMAPLSFKVAPILGMPSFPDCTCCFSMFLPAKPLISLCKFVRGTSKARQQENDHFGFLRHSLIFWKTKIAYWTEKQTKKRSEDGSNNYFVRITKVDNVLPIIVTPLLTIIILEIHPFQREDKPTFIFILDAFTSAKHASLAFWLCLS